MVTSPPPALSFAANAWPYVRCPGLELANILERIPRLGLQGVDLFCGLGFGPSVEHDAPDTVLEPLRGRVEQAGGHIVALTLVAFPLFDPAKAKLQLEAVPRFCRALKTRTLNLLPRKDQMKHSVAFDGFLALCKSFGPQWRDQGLTVTIENHYIHEDPDQDIFLIRTAADLARGVEATGGQLKVKYDPAWLCRAGEDPVALWPSLIESTVVLDLKDFQNGKFVTPGTGDVDFSALAKILKQSGRHIHGAAIEVEEHHFRDGDPGDNAAEIDDLHRSALKYYKSVFA